MQLLGERNMLHAYGEQVQSALPSPLANHISPSNTAVQKLQRRALSGSTDKLEGTVNREGLKRRAADLN